MPLRDPVAVYNAADNVDAHLVCNALVQAGVEAFAVDDVSVVGLWWGGGLPEIHKPQVWVERSDVQRARQVLEDYERRMQQRRQAGGPAETSDMPPVEVTCEECGRQSTFPASQRGTVQDCAHCGAYVDVGEVVLPDDFPEAGLGEAPKT